MTSFFALHRIDFFPLIQPHLSNRTLALLDKESKKRHKTGYPLICAAWFSLCTRGLGWHLRVVYERNIGSGGAVHFVDIIVWLLSSSYGYMLMPFIFWVLNTTLYLLFSFQRGKGRQAGTFVWTAGDGCFASSSITNRQHYLERVLET